MNELVSELDPLSVTHAHHIVASAFEHQIHDIVLMAGDAGSGRGVENKALCGTRPH